MANDFDTRLKAIIESCHQQTARAQSVLDKATKEAAEAQAVEDEARRLMGEKAKIIERVILDLNEKLKPVDLIIGEASNTRVRSGDLAAIAVNVSQTSRNRLFADVSFVITRMGEVFFRYSQAGKTREPIALVELTEDVIRDVLIDAAEAAQRYSVALGGLD